MKIPSKITKNIVLIDFASLLWFVLMRRLAVEPFIHVKATSSLQLTLSCSLLSFCLRLNNFLFYETLCANFAFLQRPSASAAVRAFPRYILGLPQIRILGLPKY